MIEMETKIKWGRGTKTEYLDSLDRKCSNLH
jgi:hypothetical protein